ncbi:MAG: hypothetical protein M1823_002538 [Watsoniomyces obsoletus]|nr:MAG: hypothetical protein M1823_002538 [Watsoniomyces obsoletus]
MATSAAPGFYQMLSSFRPDQVVAMLNELVEYHHGTQLTRLVEAAHGGSIAPIGRSAKRSSVRKNAAKKAKAPKTLGKKRLIESEGPAARGLTAMPIVQRFARPLNSFIAYRSYYSTIFSDLQQKEISGLLTRLWHADPFKAKWTILAKAYSVIRDSYGKAGSPLDLFLTINAPFLGIIAPERYLAALGWEVSVADDHCVLERQYIPEMNTFGVGIVGTDKTVHDVLQHSCDQGYLPANAANLIIQRATSANQNIMAMQVPTKPSTDREVPVSPTFQEVIATQHGIQALVSSTERTWESQLSHAVAKEMERTHALEHEQLAKSHPTLFQGQDAPTFNPFGGDKFDVHDITGGGVGNNQGAKDDIDWSLFLEDEYL